MSRSINEVSTSVALGRLGVPYSVTNQLKINDDTVYSTDFDYFETVNAINTMISIRSNIEGKENFIISNDSLSGCDLVQTINESISNLNKKLVLRIAATRKSIEIYLPSAVASDQVSESNDRPCNMDTKKGKLPRLQRIFDKFNANDEEQQILMFLLNPVHPDHVDLTNNRYPYRDSVDSNIKINELASMLQLDIGIVMRVLVGSKFAEEKFFKLKDSSIDPYGYVYEDGEHSQSVADPKFITPLHSIALKKSIRQILIGANPNSSTFIALSSTTLQVYFSNHSLLTHYYSLTITHSLTHSLFTHSL